MLDMDKSSDIENQNDDLKVTPHDITTSPSFIADPKDISITEHDESSNNIVSFAHQSISTRVIINSELRVFRFLNTVDQLQSVNVLR